MNNEFAIQVKNISKTFNLPQSRKVSVQSYFTNPFEKQKFREFSPLKDLSFNVNKGEFFSVIGQNGVGKSTLLKILAGIYAPDSGEVIVNGILVPFLELGVGFQPELTARENVYLNGVILGLTRDEVEDYYKDIVKFAELEDFQDVPIKNFSSGMKVRLGFSVAIRVRSDILLLDEVLTVGDQRFQQKCSTYFKDIKDRKTIVYVSHSLGTVKQYSDRVLYLQRDNKYDIGEPQKMIKQYKDDSN
jgi:ABC-2 type transport system ATP-binding protein